MTLRCYRLSLYTSIMALAIGTAWGEEHEKSCRKGAACQSTAPCSHAGAECAAKLSSCCECCKEGCKCCCCDKTAKRSEMKQCEINLGRVAKQTVREVKHCEVGAAT